MKTAFGVFFVAVVLVMALGLLAKFAGLLGAVGGIFVLIALYAAGKMGGFLSWLGDGSSKDSVSLSGRHSYLGGTSALLASHSQQTHGSRVGSIAAYQEDESAQTFLTEDLSSSIMASSAFQTDENYTDSLDLINDPAYSSLRCNIFHSEDSFTSSGGIETSNPFNSFDYPLDDCIDSSIDCNDSFIDCDDTFSSFDDTFSSGFNDSSSSFDDSFSNSFDDSSSSFDD